MLAALLTVTTVAVPVLDGSDRGHTPVVESEHSPTACSVLHDHTVCTQLQANQAISAGLPVGPDLTTLARSILLPEAVGSTSSSFLAGGFARAPPSV